MSVSLLFVCDFCTASIPAPSGTVDVSLLDLMKQFMPRGWITTVDRSGEALSKCRGCQTAEERRSFLVFTESGAATLRPGGMLVTEDEW